MNAKTLLGRGMSSSRTMRAGVALVIAGAALAAPAIVSAAAEGTADAVSSQITITQTPKVVETACLPGSLALLANPVSTATSFTLKVDAWTKPCEPIAAAAVVYAMPADGSLWPQTLVERKEFTISEAGTTEIGFSKGCSPVQFDVITGESPAQISPLGALHGPMLFPFDPSTAQQYAGSCATSTTAPTTLAPTTLAPTTLAPATTATPTTAAVLVTNTTPSSVAGATSIAAPTTAAPVVLGTTQLRGSGSTPGGLAVTGATSSGLGIFGASLALVGLGLTMLGRLNAATAERRRALNEVRVTRPN